MGARGNNGTRLAIDHLPDGRCRKGQGPSHLASPALDLDLITILCRALVGDVDVRRDASLCPIIPSSNGKAADPIDQRR